MALTYAEYWKTDPGTSGCTITSDSISVTSGQLITVVWMTEDNQTSRVGTVSISNTGTAISWQNIANTGLVTVGDACYVRAWYGVASATESITITTAGSSGLTTNTCQHCVTYSGQHGTTPIPAGNIYSGSKVSSTSQAITPTASGSMAWGGFGDWGATNSFAAISSPTPCTRAQNVNAVGGYTACVIQPTTQPRTDSSAFTLGETHTGSAVSYVIFEVQAAAGGSTFIPRAMLLGAG